MGFMIWNMIIRGFVKLIFGSDQTETKYALLPSFQQEFSIYNTKKFKNIKVINSLINTKNNVIILLCLTYEVSSLKSISLLLGSARLHQVPVSFEHETLELFSYTTRIFYSLVWSNLLLVIKWICKMIIKVDYGMHSIWFHYVRMLISK